MTKDEALAFDLALEALDTVVWNGGWVIDSDKVDDAITAIKQALEAPVQEPVAWRTFDGEGGYDYRSYEDNEDYGLWWEERHPNHQGWVEPLYTAPPAVPVQEPDEWLTGCPECGMDSGCDCDSGTWNPPAARRQWVGLTDAEVMQTMSGDWTSQFYFARAIEDKLKEKNT